MTKYQQALKKAVNPRPWRKVKASEPVIEDIALLSGEALEQLGYWRDELKEEIAPDDMLSLISRLGVAIHRDDHSVRMLDGRSIAQVLGHKVNICAQMLAVGEGGLPKTKRAGVKEAIRAACTFAMVLGASPDITGNSYQKGLVLGYLLEIIENLACVILDKQDAVLANK